jgi:hypothetical protein
VLRIDATVHNTRELRCRSSLDNFPKIINRLAGIARRFATTLDCADISFLPDGVLDQVPLPSRIGAICTGRIDLNKPRIRAALALAPAPHGFTVADFDWTTIDRDYETLPARMQTLLNYLGIGTLPAAAWTTSCRSEECKLPAQITQPCDARSPCPA